MIDPDLLDEIESTVWSVILACLLVLSLGVIATL